MIGNDRWVVVDVKTAGPDPGSHALLAIGACLATDPLVGCRLELVPTHDEVDPESMAEHGLSMKRLGAHGLSPAEGMKSLAGWLAESVSGAPVMVAFNASFTWMFVNHYFRAHLGFNPFGNGAIDIKALAMGWLDRPWEMTSFASLADDMGLPMALPHEAFADSQCQARLLAAILRTPHP